MKQALPEVTCRRLAWVGWLLLALAGPVVLFSCWGWLTTTRPAGIRILYDNFDMSVYHNSSRWTVAGEGVLYRDVRSEYPPLANVIFAAARIVADTLAPFPVAFDNFAWTWMSFAWVVYVGVLRLSATALPRAALWLWLNPAALYFTLLRFDIYPAALTLLALLAARRDRHLMAGLWLGLAVAVKGYPVFLVPSFAVFVWRRAGFGRGVAAGVLCLLPLVVSGGIVYSYAGWEATTRPYREHASRDLDTQSSTYDVLIDVCGLTEAREFASRKITVHALQLAMALLAAATLPKRASQLADAGLVALLGFLTLSVFYSPQFVIWVLPLAACSGSRWARRGVFALLVTSLLYFPVAYDIRGGNPGSAAAVQFYQAVIATACVLRLLVLGFSLYCLVRVRRDADETSTVGTVDS